MKREKLELAAERERLHAEIIRGISELTSHVTYVQNKLNSGVQALADKKREVMG